jgi:hypothetical protein
MVKESRQMLAELEVEGDRGAALMAAAYLDTALGMLLRSVFAGDKTVADKLLSGPYAPLSTFSSRIAMACWSHWPGLLPDPGIDQVAHGR